MVQLADLADKEFYRPQFDWIKQNEPEAHLDRLVENLISLPGVTKDAPVWGLSYKDNSTVNRFKDRGFDECHTIDYGDQIKSKDIIYSIETIQSFINETFIEKLLDIYNPPKIVICRHLIEHAHQTDKFLKALKSLVSNGSYVVLEVPESNRLMRDLDYTMLWEEHVTYFTINSLKTSARLYSMDIVSTNTYSYPNEDCLIMVLNKNRDNLDLPNDKNIIESEETLFTSFAESYLNKKKKIHSLFKNLANNKKKIAIYGSGHISSIFINLFEVDKYIEFVIDDDKNKSGMFMPGSGLPIFDSRKLAENEIDICFISMNYENEQKVRKRNHNFVQNGGSFVSITPTICQELFTMIS